MRISYAKIRKPRVLRFFIIGIGFLSVFSTILAAASGMNVRVITETARIRSQADIQGPIVAEVAQGTVLESLGVSENWMRVRLAARGGRPAIEGYILKIMVAETTEAVERVREMPVPVRPPVRGESVPERNPPRDGRAPLLSGFTLKFGFQASPDAGGFGNAWSLGAAYDHPLARNFSLGAEIHLAFRSMSDSGFNLKATSVPVLALASVKGAIAVGDLIRGLNFLTLTAGVGGGVESTFASMTIDGNSTSYTSVYPALHGSIGALADLGSVRLTLEYQMMTVKNPDIDPDGWRGFVRFGIRL